MTMNLHSVQRNATDDKGEVLVTFEDERGKLRNILLREGSEFSVPQKALDTLAAADEALTRAQQSAKAVYDAACDVAAGEHAEAVDQFNGVAERLALQQMTREDTPAPVPEAGAEE